MQPGLIVAFPDAAQIFTNYRLAKYGQALANVHLAFDSSKNRTAFSKNAAIYSWTSGRFGNCTGTGPCFDYQYHLNGDIGLQLINNWVTTGDTEYFKNKLFPIYDSIATLFADLLEKNGTKYTLTNMTDPVNTFLSILTCCNIYARCLMLIDRTNTQTTSTPAVSLWLCSP
jgi:trehalose/maltose hydrolase-like predicted phosphorylase